MTNIEKANSMYVFQQPIVIDNAHPHYEYLRDCSVQLEYSDVDSQGHIYNDVVVIPQGKSGIYKTIEKELGFKIKDKLSFVRAYRDRPDYRHPMWIHSDVLFSDYIAIHMIKSSEFPQDDGVAFWKNKELGTFGLNTKTHVGDENKIVDGQSLDPEKWELVKRVEFRENRLVIAPAAYFHSKVSYGNYGKTIHDCRIVHVHFFDKLEDADGLD